MKQALVVHLKKDMDKNMWKKSSQGPDATPTAYPGQNVQDGPNVKSSIIPNITPETSTVKSDITKSPPVLSSDVFEVENSKSARPVAGFEPVGSSKAVWPTTGSD